MHSDCGRSEGIVRWENERSPVLAIVVWCCSRTGYNIMPSINSLAIMFMEDKDKGTDVRTRGCSTPKDGQRYMEGDFRISFCTHGSTITLLDVYFSK